MIMMTKDGDDNGEYQNAMMSMMMIDSYDRDDDNITDGDYK